MDFSQVKAEFQRLKRQFEAGAIADAEFKTQLEDLMIQDEEGRWWMIGYETGQWYRHDGETWVPGEPPQPAERRPSEPLPVGAMPSPPINRLAIAALVSGIAGLVIVPVIGGVLALIFGYRARNNIRQRPGETSGEGWAMAGIAMGWLGLALWLLVFCWIMVDVGGSL